MVGTLVGKFDSAWEDMSPFVVHFTKKTNQSASDNSLSILAKRTIYALNRFGMGKNSDACPKSICFSETPLHLIGRLAKKRSSFGLGFTKQFIVDRGGGPIMYAYKDTPHCQALRDEVALRANKPAHWIWKVAPFVDAPGEYQNGTYFFEWEREWRHVGDLLFKPSEVAFLILPEALHDAARSFLEDAELENVGPNYPCPFIDPFWSKEKVKAAFSSK